MSIRRPGREKIGLSPTERMVCEYLLCGFTNAEIGEEIGITPQTVKNMVRDLLDLSGMDDRVALALWLHDHREKLGIKCPCEFGYCDGALVVCA